MKSTLRKLWYILIFGAFTSAAFGQIDTVEFVDVELFVPDGNWNERFFRKKGVLEPFSGVVIDYHNYFSKSRCISQAVEYLDGRLKVNGFTRVYYSSGFLEEETVNGENENPKSFRSWYPDGMLEMSGNYKMEAYDGIWRAYHSNGQLKYEREYVEGKKTGTWTTWSETGEIQTVEVFDDNKLIEKKK